VISDVYSDAWTPSGNLLLCHASSRRPRESKKVGSCLNFRHLAADRACQTRPLSSLLSLQALFAGVSSPQNAIFQNISIFLESCSPTMVGGHGDALQRKQM